MNMSSQANSKIINTTAAIAKPAAVDPLVRMQQEK